MRPSDRAEPDRHRQRIEQRASGQRIAHQQAVLLQDAGEVALASGHLAQAQDGPPARRPAVRLDMAARHRLEQRVNGRPSANRRVQPLLQLLRRGNVEPLAEFQQLGLVAPAGRRCRPACAS